MAGGDLGRRHQGVAGRACAGGRARGIARGQVGAAGRSANAREGPRRRGDPWHRAVVFSSRLLTRRCSRFPRRPHQRSPMNEQEPSRSLSPMTDVRIGDAARLAGDWGDHWRLRDQRRRHPLPPYGRSPTPRRSAPWVDGSGACWTPLAWALNGEFDVVMPDARGHGGSSAPHDGYRYEDHASDVVGLIRTLGLSRPVLLGHSMGGMTAAVVASQGTTVLPVLILVDPTFLSPERQHEGVRERCRRATLRGPCLGEVGPRRACPSPEPRSPARAR